MNFFQRSIRFIPFMLTLIFYSCEKESACVKCNDAINHMADKIAQNNCNPNFMENAVKRIEEDCGASRDDNAVGYLAEDCSFNYNGSLACTEIAYGLQLSDGANRPIQINAFSGFPGDTLEVLLYDAYSTPFYDRLTLIPPQFLTMEYTGNKDFGARVGIIVINQNNDTIASGEENLRYNRKDEWDLMREVKIEYDQTQQAYTMETEHW